MICFYCATPFHIMNACTLANTKFKDQDTMLIILDHFDDATQVAKRLVKQNTFSRVEVLGNKNNSIFSKLKRVMESLIPNKMIQSLVKSNEIDEYIFFAYDFLNIAYIIKKTQNKNVRFSYGDDGIGTYMEDIYLPSKKATAILKTLNRLQYLEAIQSIYVIEPDLMINNNHLEAIRIPRNSPAEITSLFELIWDFDDTKVSVNKVLYVQQPLAEMIDGDVSAVESHILESIETANIDYSIKLHPRERNLAIYNPNRIIKGSMPLEFSLVNHDVADFTFISLYSTAMFTPFLFFGKNPKLIFTYRLFTGYKKVNNFDEFIEKFNSVAGSDNSIFVPNTLEELIEIMSTLSTIK